MNNKSEIFAKVFYHKLHANKRFYKKNSIKNSRSVNPFGTEIFKKPQIWLFAFSWGTFFIPCYSPIKTDTYICFASHS